MKKLILKTQSETLGKEDISFYTNELIKIIEEQNAELEPAKLIQKDIDGTKGDLISWNEIILTLITSGAITTLITSLVAIFKREKSITFTLKQADGRETTLTAQNISDKKTKEIISDMMKEE